jgi:chaperonin GroES
LFTRDDGCAGTTTGTYNSLNFSRRNIVANVNIKPLEDKVLVEITETENTTASGLVIPDSAKEKRQEATVVAVGPGRMDDDGDRIPVDVKVGDVVIFSPYGGTELKYEDKEYLLLSARDLLAIVEK